MRNTRRIPALLPVLTLVVLICGCCTSEPDAEKHITFVERNRRIVHCQRYPLTDIHFVRYNRCYGHSL